MPFVPASSLCKQPRDALTCLCLPGRSICVSTCPSNDGLVFCSKPPCVFNSQFKCALLRLDASTQRPIPGTTPWNIP